MAGRSGRWPRPTGAGSACGLRRDDRRPYHDVYRERFPAATGQPETTPAGPSATQVFAHGLDRPRTVIIAGSAGERVQTAAAVLCQAAVLSRLHCVQKNDYPVTVGSGFSLSEVKLAPEPILYTGIDAPDAVLITSADGLKEIRGRGDLGRLAAGGIVIADESLAAELPSDRTLSLPLRQRLSPDMAALGAVAVLNERTGILDREAIRAAIGVLAGGDSERLQLRAGRRGHPRGVARGMNVPFDSLWLEVPETSEVARFLEGPQPRSHELLRAVRIFREFVRGFRRCTSSDPASRSSARRASARTTRTTGSPARWACAWPRRASR